MPKKDACGKCEYGKYVMSPIIRRMVYCCDYRDGCRHRSAYVRHKQEESIDGGRKDKHQNDRV